MVENYASREIGNGLALCSFFSKLAAKGLYLNTRDISRFPSTYRFIRITDVQISYISLYNIHLLVNYSIHFV